MVRVAKHIRDIFDKRLPSPVSDSRSATTALDWDMSQQLLPQSSLHQLPAAEQPPFISQLPAQHSTRCDELRRRIHQSHLSYLDMEDTPDRLLLRAKILDCINELLALVPHKQKFTMLDVSDCINRSIAELDQFSAYKAALAFELIEKFANNLLSQPWRREYYTIRLYTGFYKRNIESALVGARYIFHAMGYQDSSDGHTLRLLQPIDPDQVARVALDCMVAFCECNGMLKIYNMLDSQGLDINYREIYAVRKRLMSRIEDATKILREAKLKLQESKAASENGQPASSAYQHPSVNRAQLVGDSFDPKQLPGYRSPTSPSYSLSQANAASSYGHPRFHYPSSGQQQQQQQLMANSNAPNTNVSELYAAGRVQAGPPISTSLADEFARFKLNGSGPSSDVIKANSTLRSASSLSNGSSAPLAGRSMVSSGVRPKQQPTQGRSVAYTNGYVQSDQLVDEVDGIRGHRAVKPGSWSCSSCTYLNEGNLADVCHMCHRSRTKISDPGLVSGGRECPNCTLINDRDRDSCSACEVSLIGSPTYI